MHEYVELFIEYNIEDIEKKNFQKVYGMFLVKYCYIVGQFTDAMLDIGLNPLEYMEYIPNNYYTNSTRNSVSIPSTIKHIGDEAFTASNLKSISVPSTVESIGTALFRNSSILESVDMSQVTEDICIGVSTFENCIKLKEVYLPKNCYYISSYAFKSCRALKQLHIDQPMSYIKDNMEFAYNWRADSNLKQIVCSDGILLIEDIVPKYF